MVNFNKIYLTQNFVLLFYPAVVAWIVIASVYERFGDRWIKSPSIVWRGETPLLLFKIAERQVPSGVYDTCLDVSCQ